MSAWDGLNRRKFPRVKYPCLVTLKHDEGEQEFRLTHTENLGTGGLCVILKSSIKMFAPVHIELDLMDLEDHICCQGKVVWSVRRKDTQEDKPQQYDLGIEFVGLSEENVNRIEKIVQRLAKYKNMLA